MRSLYCSGRHFIAIVLCLLAAACGAFSMAPLPVGAESGPPPDVLALLPAGATVKDARSADLRGTGAVDWAVLYYTTQPGTAFEAPAVAIITAGADGYGLAQTIVPELSNAGFLTIADVAGTPAVVLFAIVGAHGGHYTIVRWDGAGFATVFDDGSDTPGYDLRDVDGDGVPEVVAGYSPYCRSYVDSPQYVKVFIWDGTRFVEWAGPYPDDVIGEPLARAGDAVANSSGWSPQDRACVLGTYAFLLAHAGDAAGAQQACSEARQADFAYQSVEFCPGMLFTPVETVRTFYGLIDARRLFDAWLLLSRGFRDQQGDELTWEQGYKTARGVTVNDALLTGDPTVVSVTITATDEIDGQTVVRTFAGTWSLVQEGGVWKLDVGRIAPVQ